MGQKFNITESERNQIRGLYEQSPTDDTIMGTLPSKLGLNPSQVLKDTSGKHKFIIKFIYIITRINILNSLISFIWKSYILRTIIFFFTKIIAI